MAMFQVPALDFACPSGINTETDFDFLTLTAGKAIVKQPCNKPKKRST